MKAVWTHSLNRSRFVRTRSSVIARQFLNDERQALESGTKRRDGNLPNFKFDSHVVWGLWGGDAGPQSE